MMLAAAGVAMPFPALAAGGQGRNFLFVFCPGGWDQAQVFAPVFNDNVDRSIPGEAAEAGGVPFVDAETRPAVRTFFEDWGHQTCLVNGMSVPSIAHEICRRIVMTGRSQAGRDDFCSLIAGHADASFPMPNVHLAGPLFPHRHAAATVRVGAQGQLVSLLDGSALELHADVLGRLPSGSVEGLEDAYTLARARQAPSAGGATGGLYAAQQVSLERLDLLDGLSGELSLGSAYDLPTRGAAILDCFEQGLSRCGMLECMGKDGDGWDTHAQNIFQDASFSVLFEGLQAILDDLATRPGRSSDTLLEETTVVVLSEMGRVPTLNTAQGKEHWTWTSAMLIGSGVRGGQAVGGWTDELRGEPVDLVSGGVDAAGVTLTTEHLGAAILRLADLDPGDWLDSDATLEAALL
jgi:hypothetical protein